MQSDVFPKHCIRVRVTTSEADEASELSAGELPMEGPPDAKESKPATFLAMLHRALLAHYSCPQALQRAYTAQLQSE